MAKAKQEAGPHHAARPSDRDQIKLAKSAAARLSAGSETEAAAYLLTGLEHDIGDAHEQHDRDQGIHNGLLE